MIIHQLVRSLENPSVPLSDFDLYDGTSSKSDTGERITRDKALEYSPVFKAIDLKSGDIAKLGCHIYRREGMGKVRDKDHPCYKMLRWQPNPYITAFHFYKTLSSHAFWGNGYAAIYRDESTGYANEAYILNPDHVTPSRINGESWYIYEPDGGKMILIAGSEMIHWHGLGFDGLCGYSILDVARHSIGMGRASQKYTNKFFANNGRPSIVLTSPKPFDPAKGKQFLAAWDERFSGLKNANRVALLTDGMSLETIQSSARDSQLIEGMEFSVRDVANWFRIPPHKLGASEQIAYNSLEQENQSYFSECLDQDLVQFEQELRAKLLLEREKDSDSHVVEFNRNALLRADMATRAAYYRTATGGRAWLKPDEVRGAENLNPVGGEADVLKDPTNNFAATGRPAGASDAPDTEADRQAAPRSDHYSDELIGHAQIAHRDALDRACTRMIRQMSRASKSPDTLAAWEETLADEQRQVAAMIGPSTNLMRALGSECIDADEMFRMLRTAIVKCQDHGTRDLPAAAELAAQMWRERVLSYGD